MDIVLNSNWVIVHIRGMAGFQDVVLSKIRGHYLAGNLETDRVMMVWLADIRKVRRLKLVIGSKIILKYRLHFGTSAPRWKKNPLAAPGFSENEMLDQINAARDNSFQVPEMVVETIANPDLARHTSR